jgi:hypothetical protein
MLLIGKPPDDGQGGRCLRTMDHRDRARIRGHVFSHNVGDGGPALPRRSKHRGGKSGLVDGGKKYDVRGTSHVKYER